MRSEASFDFLKCELDLTLPVDFVREWVSVTTKQFWTARVRSFGDGSKHGNEDDASTTVDVETHRAAMSCYTGKQKAYLCAKIKDLQLHIQNGRFRLTVLDAESRTNIDGQSQEEGLTCECSNSHTDTSKQSYNPPVVGVNCADPVLGHSLKKSTADPSECPHAEKGMDGADSGERDTQASEAADNDAVSSGVLTGSSKLLGTEHFGREAGNDVTSKQSDVPVRQINQTGAIVKRKRGRPRKGSSVPSAKSSGLDNTSAQSVSAEYTTHPPTPSGYCLRGKKLPSSIFGDSESEPEEAEDSEYQPPHKKTPGEFFSGTGLGVKEKTSDSTSSERNVETMAFEQNVEERRNQKSNNLSDFRVITDKNVLLFDTSAQDSRAESMALQTPAQKEKRNQQLYSRPKHEVFPKSAGRIKSTRKKRIKIDVTGLPSFARRKRNRERKASCKYCQRMFCDFTGVAMHVKKFHSKEKDVSGYLEELKQLSVMKCSLCGEDFSNRFQLQLHEDKVHFKAGNMQCAQCGKVFANMVLLKQHIRSVHHVLGQNHVCSLCPARFKWATTLKTHIAEVHHGIRDLVCDVCGKKFHRQAQLNRHAIIHGPEEAKLVCALCGRKFWYPNNLQRHMSIMHGPQEETWHCAYCGKGFHRKESLHNHVEKVHYSLFPYHCSICKAGFIRSTLLEKHMAAAHGETNFQAPAGRRVHFKYNRSEQDELACAMCKDKFFYKAQLVHHVLNDHRDSFPFHCDHCHQVFMERSFLAFHRKMAHGVGPEDVDFTLEEEALGQHDLPVLKALSEKIHSRGNMLSQSPVKKEVNVSEKPTVPFIAENSYLIKVQDGNSTIQYIVQNHEGHQSTSPDAFVQDIANLLQMVEQPGQGETTLPGRMEAEKDGTLPENLVLQRSDDVETDHMCGLQESVIPEECRLETETELVPQSTVTTQRIYVQCGNAEGVSDTIPDTVELEVVSSTGKSSSLSQDQDPHSFSILMAAPAVTADSGEGQGDHAVIHNVTITDTAVTDHHVTSPSDVIEQQCYTDSTAENYVDSHVYGNHAFHL